MAPISCEHNTYVKKRSGPLVSGPDLPAQKRQMSSKISSPSFTASEKRKPWSLGSVVSYMYKQEAFIYQTRATPVTNLETYIDSLCMYTEGTPGTGPFLERLKRFLYSLSLYSAWHGRFDVLAKIHSLATQYSIVYLPVIERPFSLLHLFPVDAPEELRLQIEKQKNLTLDPLLDYQGRSPVEAARDLPASRPSLVWEPWWEGMGRGGQRGALGLPEHGFPLTLVHFAYYKEIARCTRLSLGVSCPGMPVQIENPGFTSNGNQMGTLYFRTGYNGLLRVECSRKTGFVISHAESTNRACDLYQNLPVEELVRVDKLGDMRLLEFLVRYGTDEHIWLISHLLSKAPALIAMEAFVAACNHGVFSVAFVTLVRASIPPTFRLQGKNILHHITRSHRFSLSHREKLLDLAVAKGVPVNALDSHGYTSYDYCLALNDQKGMELLRKEGAFHESIPGTPVPSLLRLSTLTALRLHARNPLHVPYEKFLALLDTRW